MARYWIIHPHGVYGDPPKSQLISCQLAELDQDGTHYALFGPNGTWRALTEGPLPAKFPVFSAELNGHTKREWYIEIDGIDTASGHMCGTWGIDGHKASKDGEIDSDTWTAEATSGIKGGEEEEAVAASASSRP
jgi:hypothetical protein